MRLHAADRWGALTVAFVLVAATAGTQTQDDRALVIRIYNVFGVPRHEVASAGRQAERIFRDAGVEVVLRECRTSHGPSAMSVDRCSEVLQATEVVVRIIAVPHSGTNSVRAFGYSLVDMEKGAGTLSTVFADRITAVAARLQIDRATLLGRTLAHEVGHLLLGTNVHATDGLMRGDWPNQILRADSARDWRFTRPEVDHIATALRNRVTPKTAVLASLVPARPDGEGAGTR